MKPFNYISFLRNSLFLLLLVSFMACGSEQTPENTNTDATTITDNTNGQPMKLAVNQPFKNVNQSPKTLTHKDTKTAQSFTMESGTVIQVPANAYVHMDGKPVEGAVELKFTEMHKTSEIIASGIPMKYIDEKGEVQWMQSAGMYEIQGLQNGQAVQIAEGKSIEVALVSDVAGDYDFWVFDEEKGNWINEGPVEAKEGPTRKVTTPEVTAKINNLRKRTKKKPKKPEVNEANKLVFNDLNLDRCPELKGQKPLVLLYAGDDKSKSPEENKWIRKPGLWHKKTITPVAGSDGLYELTLFGDKMYQIKVEAAPTALEIDKNNKAYQAELAEYRANMKLLGDAETMMENRQDFIRMTRVRGFGIHNCDALWARPDAVNLMADVDIEEVPGMVEDLALFYFITDNGRTVINLPKQAWKRFRFSPSTNNKILAILPDKTAAVFSEGDFEQQKGEMISASETEGEEFVFSLDKTGEKVESLDDLDGILDDASIENTAVVQQINVYPNPARDRATVTYECKESIATPILIFNSNGQQVAMQNTTSQIGSNKVELDVANLPSGNYIVRITAGSFSGARQLIIAK